jgi:hypothetical protein
MKRFPRFTRWAALALGTLWPALAQACPVCFAASERSRVAFFDMTMFMSLLPLGMIGGGLWWLRHGGRAFLSSEFEDRDAYDPSRAEEEPSDEGDRKDEASG